jgi:hypothetical protein
VPEKLPDKPDEYRISHAEREAVMDRLRDGMAEGRIDLYEFESRLDIVLNAKVAADLVPAVADLPPAPAEVKQTLKRRRKMARASFYGHLVPYLATNGFLVMIWGLSGAGHFWPAYVMGGWGIGLASHGVAAFSVGREQKPDHPRQLKR